MTLNLETSNSIHGLFCFLKYVFHSSLHWECVDKWKLNTNTSTFQIEVAEYYLAENKIWGFLGKTLAFVSENI